MPSGVDLLYCLSLRIDGFYWPLGSSGSQSDLTQEIRPVGQGEASSGIGMGGLFSRQGVAGWEGRVMEAQPPQAEPVL